MIKRFDLRSMYGRRYLSYAILINLAISWSCTDETPVNQIPFVLVNRTINLTNQQFLPLQLIRGHIELNDEGIRGIILYRQDANTYRAFERNCSFDPLNNCAQVKVDDSGFFMIDSCCSSTFDFEGFPTGGPATLPLREYLVSLEGDFLTISSGF